jgi:hypothetical protein
VADLAAGGEDSGGAGRDRGGVQSRSELASISPETVTQAGAGALLLAIALVELWLAFWAAGWWHRGGAFALAIAGAVLLVHAVRAVGLPLRRESSRGRPRREFVRALDARAPAVLAESAQA